MTVVLLIADGARPDTLPRAIAAGRAPALARLAAEGTQRTITSVFPSVTGPAYLPFLTGCHPGRLGIPGIRWWDRAQRRARSYVGIEAMVADRDLHTEHPTLFESVPGAIAALSPFNRGLARAQRLDGSAAFWLRLAWHHFRGDLPGWLRFEQEFATAFTQRVHKEQPPVAMLALPGIDKCSHRFGHAASEVLDAVAVVDSTVAQLQRDAERAGRQIEIWITSDHGHATVHAHDDLADLLRTHCYGIRAHPWTMRGGDEIAVMASGNAMAHLYLDLTTRERLGWDDLRPRWAGLLDLLLSRKSMDLVILPIAPDRCELHGRGRGMAHVTRDDRGRYGYRAMTGDPLGLLAHGSNETLDPLDSDAAHAITLDTDYPDALVQILALANATRSGEVICSAAPGWDFRERYEPIPHRSCHGALHREQMLVPLLMSSQPLGTPRRTVDLYPSLLSALGQRPRTTIDGRSFR
jgi:arylsulfatase A-like enzyme